MTFNKTDRAIENAFRIALAKAHRLQPDDIHILLKRRARSKNLIVCATVIDWKGLRTLSKKFAIPNADTLTPKLPRGFLEAVRDAATDAAPE